MPASSTPRVVGTAALVGTKATSARSASIGDSAASVAASKMSMALLRSPASAAVTTGQSPGTRAATGVDEAIVPPPGNAIYRKSNPSARRSCSR
ncbi:hypothetical protein GALL_538920 [mine drainage metagenome]|uniref:Uncharacterized protein n=1 Tax=mine drainage metagenome TaxID=410659 RepID=A0A1J5PLZ7_9ZZZZ